MTVAAQLEDIDLNFMDLWPRVIEFGDAQGFCGDKLIVTVSRAFTLDEDKVFRWVSAQDDVELIGMTHVPDGREIMLFERKFMKQSAEDARAEHAAHLRTVLSRLNIQPATQHDSNATHRG